MTRQTALLEFKKKRNLNNRGSFEPYKQANHIIDNLIYLLTRFSFGK